MGPEYISRLPVERLALALLEHSQADPSLIARGGAVAAPSIDRTAPIELGPIPPLALLSDPTFDIRQYLEDLASIAATSAQQAEDSLVEARVIARKARRGMVAIALFGAFGLLIGGAGFNAHRNASAQLHEVNSEVSSLHKLQHEADDQLQAIKAGAEKLNTALKAAATQAAVAYVPEKPVPPNATVEATVWTPASAASTPWPDSRQYMHPVVVQRQRPVAPQFLVAINRGLHALFH